jgi:hypothetical protein
LLLSFLQVLITQSIILSIALSIVYWHQHCRV